MKKGTPTNVVSNGTWTNQQGKVFYKWNVTMDNGDFGGAMTGAENQDKWVVGKEVTYTAETKGQFTNFKLVEEKPAFTGGSKVDPKQQGVITYLSAVSTAVNFYAQRSNGSEEAVLTFAERIYQKTIEKKSN